MKTTDPVNFRELRERANLTLSQLAEITGYSVATINGLELHGEGSRRLKDRLVSVLLSRAEEGVAAEVKHWRDRAIAAEERVAMLKSGLEGLLKKI